MVKSKPDHTEICGWLSSVQRKW